MGHYEYIDWAVNDYNAVRSHSSLHYMKAEKFKASMNNEDFRKVWNEKEVRRHEHVELLE